jgi:cytochrome c553
MVRLRCHGRKMDSFGNDEIARLLRLKRYEQPPADYFENFLSEFRRRQRDELLRQPPWLTRLRSDDLSRSSSNGKHSTISYC